MHRKRTLAALCLVPLIAAAGLAQEGTSAEFSRVSGGEIALVTKQPQSLSGSLGMFLGGSNGRKGYETTLGGNLLEDRLWFFAAASQSEGRWFASSLPQMPERAVSEAIDAKLTAQLGDRQILAASFAAGREPFPTSPTTVGDPIPSSFLSLRYTGIVSSTLFFNATFSRHSVTRPALAPLQ